jgi:hypothetical protein
MVHKLAIVAFATLGLACLVAWPISYHRTAVVECFNDSSSPVCTARAGPLIGNPPSVRRHCFDARILRGSLTLFCGQPIQTVHALIQQERAPRGWRFAGCELVFRADQRSSFMPWSARVPLWLAAVLFLAFPAWSVALGPSARRRRRERLGLCARCGYSRHGNVSNVCPECGENLTAIVPRATAFS